MYMTFECLDFVMTVLNSQNIVSNFLANDIFNDWVTAVAAFCFLTDSESDPPLMLSSNMYWKNTTLKLVVACTFKIAFLEYLAFNPTVFALIRRGFFQPEREK